MPNTKYSENLVIFILSGLFFFHIVEFMILMPLGPQLMRVRRIDAQQFSHLVAIYNFSAAVSGIFGILWMDRWDRKKLLIHDHHQHHRPTRRLSPNRLHCHRSWYSKFDLVSKLHVVNGHNTKAHPSAKENL